MRGQLGCANAVDYFACAQVYGIAYGGKRAVGLLLPVVGPGDVEDLFVGLSLAIEPPFDEQTFVPNKYP